MIDKFLNFIFSTRLTAVLLIIFAIAIGVATFIEANYDTAAAKVAVFNAKWLEFILLLLTLNLIGNIFKFKLYRKEKLTVFIFHISFIVILFGAAITRYIGYEGVMKIREGAKSSTVISDEIFLQVKIDNGEMQKVYPFKVMPNEFMPGYFSKTLDFQGTEFEFNYKGFIKNSVDSLVEFETDKKLLEIVTTAHNERLSVFIEEGTTEMIGDYPVSYNDNRFPGAIQLTYTDSGMIVNSPYEMDYMTMQTQSTGKILADSIQMFSQGRLYSVGKTQMVYKDLHRNKKIEQISVPEDEKEGVDALVVDISSNGEFKEQLLFGGRGYYNNNTVFGMNGLNVTMSFGSRLIPVPFEIALRDFQLDRYPGTNNPSSFASELTLIDEKNGVNEDHRVFMNTVLDYGGFRFFQSSYDPDELGTILSVNHDFLGTWVTYVGYMLMMFAMTFTLFVKKTRFSSLKKKLNKIKGAGLILVAGFIMSFNSSAYAQADGVLEDSLENAGQTIQETKENAQNILSDFVNDGKHQPVSLEHAQKFEKILVQGKDGRIKPYQTLAAEILRKISRKNSWDGLTPTQVMLGMINDPIHWQQVDMIKIGHDSIKSALDTKESLVSFYDLFNQDGSFKFADVTERAFRKREKDRSKVDQEILKLAERLNIVIQVYNDGMLSAFPVDGDPSLKWYMPLEVAKLEIPNKELLYNIFQFYRESLANSVKANDYKEAETAMNLIFDYQNKLGGDLIPSESKINLEVKYNKWLIFNKLFIFYFILGFLMLIPLFIDILTLSKSKVIKVVIKIFQVLLIIATLFHAFALGARWYISGHAPWSNAYEALTYIAFITMLAGFALSKKSKINLMAATILSGMTLMVAHLNFLDPDIGNLVPVLKSYWLMVHVAIITASYAFLGLSAILGLLTMFIYILRNERNKDHTDQVIAEMTINNEMSMTVGLFMAAIGTFLGGIWANESWGRYWGWDSKETWALVIVLVYAMVLHFRLIPKMKGKYTFALSSVWAYSTVLMTFFGVNYFLVGLHSYAGGGTPEIPNWVIPTIVFIGVLCLFAWLRKRSLDSRIEMNKSIKG